MNTYNTKVLILGSMLVIGFVGTTPNHFQSQIMAGLCILSLLIALDIWKATTWSAAVLFVFATWSGLFYSLWPFTPFLKYTPTIQTNMVMSASQSALFILGVTVFALYVVKTADEWLQGFMFLACASALLTVYNFICFKTSAGILSNASVDAVFFTLNIPWIVKKRKWLSLFLVLVAMALEVYQWHSVTGIIILAAQCLLALWFLGAGVYSAVGLGVMVGALQWKLSTPEKITAFMDGRQGIYKDTIDAIKTLHHYVFGNGSGSFIAIMPTVVAQRHPEMVWFWAHNEYLQIYFELGIVGLILTLVLYWQMLVRSYREPWLFTTVVALGIGCVSQYPLRLFPSALLAAIVCKKCFEKRGLTHA